jgi:tight adherence protein B
MLRSSRSQRTLRSVLAVTAVSISTLFAAAAPAMAAEGSIDHVEQSNGVVRVLYSVKGAPEGTAPDLTTLTVTLSGDAINAEAENASGSGGVLKRTTVIVMDASKSMAGSKFEQAKAAANVFLDAAPDDLYVGLVVFAGSVVTAQDPTQDKDAVRAALDALTLTGGTSLYQGVVSGVAAAGTSGGRNLLILSDGKDTTGDKIGVALTAVREAEIKVDAVSLSSAGVDTAPLSQITDAGNGGFLSATPEELEAVFAAEAEVLNQQILITFDAPEGAEVTEGTLEVSVLVGGETVTDNAFVAIEPAPNSGPVTPDIGNLESATSRFTVSRLYMILGLVAAGAGILVLLISALGGSSTKQDALSDSIEAYTRAGARRLHAAPKAQDTNLTTAAVGVAQRALESNKDLESRLGQKLEAAGLALKPAEWLLLHAGIAVGAGVAGLLLGGTNLAFMILGVVGGLVVPWIFLGFKHSRRLRSFNSNLANTLQLMSSSLSAGLSLAQGVDTVVREGTEPIAGEFRRALVEARLGVDLEDALDGVAERMQSKDFEWVVMAIRIQREVGGNLAELLNNVAGTIREREFLERQVKALSAEGRLSVWILGSLAPGFLAYLAMANPDYLHPLVSTPIGLVLLGMMFIMETAGVLWMRKLVKVEV